MNGIDTTHLLSVLEHTAQLLKDMGAPAREAAAVAAHAAIRAELSSALQAGDSPALAAAVVKAVRVLMAQLKMLRMDAANFKLKMLAHSLKDGAGIRYAPHIHHPTAASVSTITSLCVDASDVVLVVLAFAETFICSMFCCTYLSQMCCICIARQHHCKDDPPDIPLCCMFCSRQFSQSTRPDHAALLAGMLRASLRQPLELGRSLLWSRCPVPCPMPRPGWPWFQGKCPSWLSTYSL